MSQEIENKEKKLNEKYDGVHLLAFFAIAFIREYFHLSFTFFFITTSLYYIVAYYFLEKWKMRTILKYIFLALIAFLISKFLF